MSYRRKRKHFDRRRRLERVADGKCQRCGRVADRENRSDCSKCALRSLARVHLGNPNRWDELYLKLKEQDFRCAYSGRVIALGVNASIDHFRPRVKYPHLARDISNLYWVDEAVNRMKSDLEFPDFLRRCQSVLEYHGYEIRIPCDAH